MAILAIRRLMMSKLWQKGYELDALVEQFTVGDDYLLDARLVDADIAGSLAHAAMLAEVGLLSTADEKTLRSGLLQILDENHRGEFTIEQTDEDGHTALENRLISLVGEVGKRIHLGRSRNDQVLTVTRLWMRDYLFSLIDRGCGLVSDLLEFAQRNAGIPMPGRTHMQPAMPSSVGLWAASFAEQFLDDLRNAAALYPYFDQCPLGSGAGYGTPLPLNREKVAELLGFSRVQVNVAYAGLSRGKFESRLLDVLDQIGITLSKLAQDLILYSMPEFGWFTLPQELCTGSSIMPQKRNPDALELMRARAAGLGALSGQVKSIIRSLPSGYNRDFQDTKGPMLKAADSAVSMILVSALSIRKLIVNEKALVAAFDPGIFATDAAIKLVSEGLTFRDAYREVGTHPEKLEIMDPYDAIKNRSSTGTTGNLRLDLAREGLQNILAENEMRERSVRDQLVRLTGTKQRLC